MRQSCDRQIVEPPCRVFYRYDGARVFLLRVLRGERQFRKALVVGRDSGSPRA